MSIFTIIGLAVCALGVAYALVKAARFCIRLVISIIMVRQWRREEQA